MGEYALRNTILDLLLRIEQGSGYSHLLIDRELRNNNIPKKDRGLLTEIVYGTIQRQLTLDYYLRSFVQSKKKQKPWVKTLLRMSVYQMTFLDKVPDHAIIHEAVEIAKQRGHKGIASFVNGVLRNIQRQGVPNTSDIKDDAKRLSIETSHPEWLIKEWIHDYGYELTEQMCYANVEHKPMTVRVQPMKITRSEAMQRLTQEGLVVEPSPISKQGLIIKQGNVLGTSLFKQGMLTIQDQSSMLVGDMVDAEPGMKVLDTCSAPGGKATHLAETMNNQGTIKAHDLHQNKIKLIDDKAKELSLSIIEASQNDARSLDEIYEPESFARILVDAPCTGFGVARGKPDIKLSKQQQGIEQLSRIQQDILNHAAPLLKKGGYLVYSTCTVNKKENDDVVQTFLKNHEDFIVDPLFFTELPDVVKESPGITSIGLQLFPQDFQSDGFFLTRLKKKE